ncbi:phospholipid/cholesterol/gamma-HCH transport system substrate-binding protein [Zobellia uliginosa]|uniref:Phospholipid/cholesterol/gamma-HCH transport system substrate-binding protein n=1 Tax=Zobellia uliginosa TaxID=143224 RepID=A0ABY1KN43_9FLAO|nr:MlaD family protein [Zobellia uliginosa]SIS50773.1 phospholipid/cholesterol/gamma-HCH transport system substrate-binding protein [Zobellia uliginosa]
MKLSREIKTGIIVIGGILLFILGFSYLKSSPLFEDGKTIYAVYNEVGGLQVGTPVTINGFVVGKVTDVKFKDQRGHLLVTLFIKSDFEFSKNSFAELYDTGIIGGKGIQVKPVFDGAPMATSGDTLTSKIQLGLTQLVQKQLTPLQQKVEGAVTNADSLLMNVNEVLDDKAKKDLRETLSGLNATVASFQKSADMLSRILSTNEDNLNQSLNNFQELTSNFAKLSDSLNNAGLGNTLANLESTMVNLNKLMSNIEKGDGTLGKLMKDEELYTNLNNASRELDLLLQDFRLNPKRYVNVSVFGKKQIDYELPEDDPANLQPQPQPEQ